MLAACAAVAASSVVSVTGCGSKGKSDAQESVTVGLLHSLTGSMAISEGSVRDERYLQLTRSMQQAVCLESRSSILKRMVHLSHQLLQVPRHLVLNPR